MFADDKMKSYVAQLEQKGLLRKRLVLNPQSSSLVHFDSNDYLSLTRDERVAKGYQRGYSLYSSGSGASMLLSGYHPNHVAVEEAFAKFLAVDECILLSSGYAANLALTSLFGKLKLHSFIDKEIHASVYDGLAAVKANYTRFFHNDITDIARKMTTHASNSVLITEGIFSMSGQISPLRQIAPLCRQNQTDLIVDEAHSFGLLGNEGRGSIAYHGLSQKEVPLRVIPLGKAFAAQGALIAGKSEWIAGLVQAGRSCIYSTAMSPALSYGLLHTLDIVINAEDRRLKLNELICLFRNLIKGSPFNWADSYTPIQQLQLGCPHQALYYAQELKKNGMSCWAIRQPTVSLKETGLRIILNYNHTPEQLHILFACLGKLYEYKNP